MFKRFLFLIVVLSSVIAYSQTYVSLGVGYGISSASEIINTKATVNGEQNVYGTFGSGLNIEGAIGNMMNENFGLELGISYKSGSSIAGTNETSRTPLLVTYDTKNYGSYFGINPSVVLSTKISSIAPYAKFGFILAFPSATREENETGNATKYEFSGGIAFGYTGAVGVKFGADKVQFFAELGLTSLSWAPTKLKYTTPRGSTEIDLKDETPASTPGTTTTSMILPQMMPFSNIGLNVGARLAL
jgi:hypothetical protein